MVCTTMDLLTFSFHECDGLITFDSNENTAYNRMDLWFFFGEVNHDYDDQGFYRYSCDEDEYYATQVYLMFDYTTTEQVV